MAAVHADPPRVCRTQEALGEIQRVRGTARKGFCGDTEDGVWNCLHQAYPMGGPYAIYTRWDGGIFFLYLVE